MFYFVAKYDFCTQYFRQIDASNLDEALEKMKGILKLNSHVKFNELLLLDVKDVIKFDPKTGEVLPSECLIVERKPNEDTRTKEIGSCGR